ncbi:MAG TPA: helicase HerA-like domain-containing protein [Casimicrobiaceae bacterium]
MPEPMLIARHGDRECLLLPALCNRHGLITGATGTGKTVTLQVIAEHLSALGVPVFMADVKGDLAGLSQPGQASPKLADRLQAIGAEMPKFQGFPTVFWDVYGEQGHPVRATVSDMGPLLLSRILQLNDTQEGVLTLAFKIADDNGLLLLDLKDLRALLQHVGENAADFQTAYGNVSAASIGAIQRGLLGLEQQGADRFLGEPMLNVDDLLQTIDGKGAVNILAADRLMQSPKVYSTLLLWLLSELYERLPEVGDRDKPKLVFFFDEAHLLFTDAPKPLLEKIEQVVRLVRSKGVGVFFVTQNPLDVPDTVLGQLGNRVQHALRAFTPRDQKAVKAAAETMRANPAFRTEDAITELGVGEALVSFLDEKGRPAMVERVYVMPPASRIGPITPDERKAVIAGSPVAGAYEKAVDRESAYEKLKARADAAASAAPAGTTAGAGTAAPGGGVMDGLKDVLFGSTGPRGGRREGMIEAMAKTAGRTASSALTREIVRGVLGSLLGGGKRR